MSNSATVDVILSALQARRQIGAEAIGVAERRTQRVQDALNQGINQLSKLPSLIEERKSEDDEKAVNDAFTAAMANGTSSSDALDTIAQVPVNTARGAAAKASLGMRLENVLRARDLDAIDLRVKKQALEMQQAQEARAATKAAREKARLGAGAGVFDFSGETADHPLTTQEKMGMAIHRLMSIQGPDGQPLYDLQTAIDAVSKRYEPDILLDKANLDAETKKNIQSMKDENALTRTKLMNSTTAMGLFLRLNQAADRLKLDREKFDWNKAQDVIERTTSDAQFKTKMDEQVREFNVRAAQIDDANGIRQAEFANQLSPEARSAVEDLKLMRALVAYTPPGDALDELTKRYAARSKEVAELMKAPAPLPRRSEQGSAPTQGPAQPGQQEPSENLKRFLDALKRAVQPPAPAGK